MPPGPYNQFPCDVLLAQAMQNDTGAGLVLSLQFR